MHPVIVKRGPRYLLARRTARRRVRNVSAETPHAIAPDVSAETSCETAHKPSPLRRAPANIALPQYSDDPEIEPGDLWVRVVERDGHGPRCHLLIGQRLADARGWELGERTRVDMHTTLGRAGLENPRHANHGGHRGHSRGGDQLGPGPHP
jgi:hypothetical protein